MPDYSKGKIYCIRSHNTDLVYIGSTIQPLSVRIGGHKQHYKAFLIGKKNFVSSFEILEFCDFYIELIENYPCENKEELHRKEGEYIRSMNCVNKCIAGRTNKERYTDNIKSVLKNKKKYYQKNIDEIKKTHREYYHKNKEQILKKNESNNREKYICECGSNIRKDSKYKHEKNKKHLNWFESQK